MEPAIKEKKRKRKAESEDGAKKKKPPLDMEAIEGNVVCVCPKPLKKHTPVGMAFKKGNDVRERVKEGELKALDNLSIRGIPWRQLLSYDYPQDPPLRMHLNHSHDAKCLSDCTKEWDEEAYTFRTLTHAIQCRRFLMPFAFEFTMESRSRISSSAELAKSVALKKRTTCAKKSEGGRTIQLRPHLSAENPNYKRDKERLWHDQCVLALCRQNQAYRRCLLATGEATIMSRSPAEVLVDLMSVRKRIDPHPSSVHHPDKDVQAACKPYRLPGELLNEVRTRVTTAQGEIILIPPLSVPKEELVFVSRRRRDSPLVDKLVSFWKKRGLQVIRPDEAVDLAVIPLDEQAIMHTISLVGIAEDEEAVEVEEDVEEEGGC